ncbi:hypothetical protein ABZ348_15265 [Streptomyces sp. NPDC005963]|uniref:hypothetical protein n=1 Tax=Streptomyces sp. NPDC005963 TaxID=3156721 RepID=UPI00340E608A
MRDLIVCALAWVLYLVRPTRQTGQPAIRTAPTVLPQHTSTHVPGFSAWARPWTGPSAELARSIFRAEEANTLTPQCRERYFATAWAEHGYDYPYVAAGVHQVRTGAVA